MGEGNVRTTLHDLLVEIKKAHGALFAAMDQLHHHRTPENFTSVREAVEQEQRLLSLLTGCLETSRE